MTDFNESTEATTESAEAAEETVAGNESRFDNVRAYRHAALGALSKGREVLAIRTPETGEVYGMINGVISEILRGRTGLNVEQQVAHLDDALTKVTEAKEALPEKVEAAKAAVIAMIDSWDEVILGQVQEAFSVLREAKEFAATRDFEAHQERKHSRGGYHNAFADSPVFGSEPVDTYDDTDEDYDDEE